MTIHLGRLTKVERTVDTTTITIAEYTYNEPSGYLATAKSLKPGTTSGELVTTSYTYDDLGNMLTVTTPGNDAASTITTTYEYETDGSYSQDAAVGQPLYVEDALGNRTHFRYDQFGRRIRVIDALGHGNRTYYNLAGQVIRVNQGGDIDGATSPILTLVAEKVGDPPNLLSATASAMLRLPDATNPDVLVRPLTALPAFQATPFSADVLAFSLPVSTSGSYIVEEVNVSLVGASGTWDESNYWKLTLQTRDEALEVVSEVSSETFAAAGAGLVTLLGVADSGTVYTYLYPGGPTLRQEVVDRNGDALQTIEYSSGAEGELLAVSGGTEPVAYTYNALYQQTSLTDGNEQTTLFAYDSKHRPSLIRYPGASAEEGYDTVRFTLYDDAGRLLRRIDGRDIVTACDVRNGQGGLQCTRGHKTPTQTKRPSASPG